MDLRIFDFDPVPKGKRPMKDRLNGSTGFLKCRLLEWTGWYNLDVYQRLLGHYRLFQHFKKDKRLRYRRIPPYQAYILNYRATHQAKYFISKMVAFIFTTVTREPSQQVEMEGLNQILINERADVLQQFLADSETDFEQALLIASEKIQAPAFICRTGNGFSSSYQVQVNNQFNKINETQIYNDYTEVHETFEVHVPPAAAKEGAQGKEKGVFSKKQILMLFDLMAEDGLLERIDYSRPHKFEDIADLMHALTGKGKASFVEELKNCKTKGLYEARTEEEFKQVIRTLMNLGEIFRKAGFRNVAKLVDKKMRELERESGGGWSDR